MSKMNELSLPQKLLHGVYVVFDKTGHVIRKWGPIAGTLAFAFFMGKAGADKSKEA